MNQELYFIPVLTRALERADAPTALGEAFREIHRAGRRPEFREAYDNFQRFMEEVVRQVAEARLTTLEDASVRELIADLATDTFEGTADEHQCAHGLVQSRPEWAAEYEALRSEIAVRPTAGAMAEILVMREATVVAQITLSRKAERGFVSDVFPGRYVIALETGRLIWKGDLTERLLIWKVAFPDRALDIAAATGETPGDATREEVLLGGELILRVFPGLESGRLELELRG